MVAGVHALSQDARHSFRVDAVRLLVRSAPISAAKRAAPPPTSMTCGRRSLTARATEIGMEETLQRGDRADLMGGAVHDRRVELDLTEDVRQPAAANADVRHNRLRQNASMPRPHRARCRRASGCATPFGQRLRAVAAGDDDRRRLIARSSRARGESRVQTARQSNEDVLWGAQSANASRYDPPRSTRPSAQVVRPLADVADQVESVPRRRAARERADG
jgi:hypothetical protein